VVDSAEVHGEISRDRQMVVVSAELDIVVTLYPGEVITELMPLLHPVHKRERLTPKKGKAGNVYRHISAARSARKVVEQSATRILVAQIINLVLANNPGVLPTDAAIVVVLG